MSTRGCVAVGVPGAWAGVYNHCDSYPTALGRNLWHKLQIARRGSNLNQCLLDILTSKRWEVFYGTRAAENYTNAKLLTPGSQFDLEWEYIIDVKANVLHAHGWKHEWSIPLDGPEPIWDSLEENGNTLIRWQDPPPALPKTFWEQLDADE